MSAGPHDSVETRTLIWRMFRDAADEDYLAARLGARARSAHQFAWSAQQATEKILKCSLLMNGYATKSFGHDIESLYAEVKKYTDGLIPDLWCPPNDFPETRFMGRRFEPMSEIVKRIAVNGEANNRYRYYNVTVYWHDLHKLDELYFLLRRLAYPMEMRYGPPSFTFRQAIMSNPDLQPHPDICSNRKDSHESTVFRRTGFRWRNYSFFRSEPATENGLMDGLNSIRSPISAALGSKTITRDRASAIQWVADKAMRKGSDHTEVLELLAAKEKR